MSDSARGLARKPGAEQPQHQLQDDDLLGSFDDELTDHALDSHAPHRRLSKTSSGRSPQTAPIHVKLPPRPSEISPDYQPPPARSPRRLSQPYIFAGPSSPPLVSDIGNDIIFHPGPSQDTLESKSPRRRTSFNTWSSGSPTRHDSSSAFGNAHSKLLDTLTSTQKMASKRRHAADPAHSNSPLHPEPLLDLSPIDVTHVTPFATQEQAAGSYIPPSGAPAFSPAFNGHEPSSGEDPYPKLRLLGRREDVALILRQEDADSLRQHLPPRQKLEDTWNLKCKSQNAVWREIPRSAMLMTVSLDQHGSSLATLYRMTEKTPKGAGNLLMAMAANGMRFGVFINEAIIRKEGAYYGSGEAFLYKIADGGSRVFTWTGRNQYFALCESGFISFGGGGGAYGLILDATFNRNSSATSPAFDNEILCDTGDVRSDRAHRFDCVGLEIWATA